MYDFLYNKIVGKAYSWTPSLIFFFSGARGPEHEEIGTSKNPFKQRPTIDMDDIEMDWDDENRSPETRSGIEQPDHFNEVSHDDDIPERLAARQSDEPPKIELSEDSDDDLDTGADDSDPAINKDNDDDHDDDLDSEAYYSDAVVEEGGNATSDAEEDDKSDMNDTGYSETMSDAGRMMIEMSETGSEADIDGQLSPTQLVVCLEYDKDEYDLIYGAEEGEPLDEVSYNAQLRKWGFISDGHSSQPTTSSIEVFNEQRQAEYIQ